MYLFVCQAAIISAFGLMFGFYTRLSGIILTISLFYIWSVPCFFGKLNHNQVQCWTALILALSNSGRVLSIDSLIRKYIFKESIGYPTATRLRNTFSIDLLDVVNCVFLVGCYKKFGTMVYAGPIATTLFIKSRKRGLKILIAFPVFVSTTTLPLPKRLAWQPFTSNYFTFFGFFHPIPDGWLFSAD